LRNFFGPRVKKSPVVQKVCGGEWTAGIPFDEKKRKGRLRKKKEPQGVLDEKV